MSNTLRADTHLTLTPNYFYDGEPRSFRITRATKKPPAALNEGEVVVKITLEVPKGAFLPLTPSTVIHIPEDMIQHDVVVEAVE